MSNVTVVSCVYGDTHWQFSRTWWNAIHKLDPAPGAIIVATDNNVSRRATVEATCTWQYPQAFYLQKAIELAQTDWVWICDIDDIAYPDALAGLEDVEADVWQMGYDRSDGLRYIPPRLTGHEFASLQGNVYVAGSAIRRDAFLGVGGFRDVAYQDWDLWLRLAKTGATFEPSGRTHFRYMRHPQTRGELELTTDERTKHIREMDLDAVA